MNFVNISIEHVQFLCGAGKYREAAEICEAAINLKIKNIDYFSILCAIYIKHSMYEKALKVIDSGLKIDEKNIKLLNNSGVCLYKLKRYFEAENNYKKAIALSPDYAAAYANLGNLYTSMCEHGRAAEFYRHGLNLEGNINSHSNLILSMLYDGAVHECYLESVNFGNTYKVSKKYSHTRKNKNNPKIRIGFLTSDLNRHPVANFMMPIFKEYDNERFELVVFNLSVITDAISSAFRELADLWINVYGCKDEEIAEIIFKNQIDILFDLAGHTGNNRLLVFKSKPAPIQVSYLGYPATTGICEVDYRLTDNFMDPPGDSENMYVENIWRINNIFCSYMVLGNVNDEITSLPMKKNGYITYGTCANISKYSNKLIKSWVGLSEKNPTAKFIFEISGVEDENLKEKICERFKNNGFKEDRFKIIAREPNTQYMLYKYIDISLDTFPLVGGTTSFDSLWMGVPFVTMEGRESSSRIGVTILSNAGLTDLIARSEDEYVLKILELSNSVERLEYLRANLRSDLMKTNIFNGKLFIKDFELSLSEMMANTK